VTDPAELARIRSARSHRPRRHRWTPRPAAPAGFDQRDRRVASTSAHMAGISLLFVALGMAVCGVLEALAGDPETVALLAPAVLTGVAGLALWRGTRVPARIPTAAAFAAVTTTWVVLSVAGALPYLLAGVLSWDESLFEAVSGFTGTGSTVLSPIEGNGAGLLMWRQLTQWYGGMGIIVLVVAVLPLVGVGGFELLRAESPGPTSDRLAPRVSDTAKRLWLVYLGMTVVVAGALAVAGMGAYDAVAHSLTTVGTGGFSPRDASIGHFDSVAIEVVLIASMLAGAISFTLWWRVLRGRTMVPLWRSSELRFYLAFLGVALAVVTAVLVADGDPLPSALRHGAFNVASLGTTTGFGTVDFVRWGAAAQLVLVVLMVCGGMAGSTSGAVKQFRVETLFVHARREVRRVSAPRAVLPVKLGGHAVPEEIVTRIVGFVTLYFILSVAGIVALAALGADLPTSVGSVVTAIGAGGPGLGETGPAATFLALDRPSRAILMGYMLLGRLEVFPLLLVLAAPVRLGRGWARRHGHAVRRLR
jgi:trk system potassium uptake protein